MTIQNYTLECHQVVIVAELDVAPRGRFAVGVDVVALVRTDCSY